MRLTLHTDYALRVLIHVAIADGRLITISDIAERFDISKQHSISLFRAMSSGWIGSEPFSRKRRVRFRSSCLRAGRPTTSQRAQCRPGRSFTRIRMAVLSARQILIAPSNDANDSGACSCNRRGLSRSTRRTPPPSSPFTALKKTDEIRTVTPLGDIWRIDERIDQGQLSRSRVAKHVARALAPEHFKKHRRASALIPLIRSRHVL
jgi:hypothetical protein